MTKLQASSVYPSERYLVACDHTGLWIAELNRHLAVSSEYSRFLAPVNPAYSIEKVETMRLSWQGRRQDALRIFLCGSIITIWYQINLLFFRSGYIWLQFNTDFTQILSLEWFTWILREFFLREVDHYICCSNFARSPVHCLKREYITSFCIGW